METLLTTSLHRVGRRLLAIAAVSAVAWATAAALLMLLAGVWLDLLWELPPQVRFGAGILALLCGIVVLARLVWLAQRRRTTLALARRLDEVGKTGGEILSGADLVRRPVGESALTSGLALLAVARAGRIAAQVPATEAAPASPIRWSLATLGLTLAPVVLAAVFLPRLAQAEWLRFSDPFGDHPPYSRLLFHVQPGDTQVVYGSGLEIRVTTEGPPVDRLHLVLQPVEGGDEETVPLFAEPSGEWRATLTNVVSPCRYLIRAHIGRSARYSLAVITVPRIESVRFRITPPAYTNRPATDGPLPQGGLLGLPGTRVEVRARSNRQLSGGSLELADADKTSTLDLKTPAPESMEVSGAFEIRQAGKLRLKVVDMEGQASTTTFTAAIGLLTDERPSIRLIEPPLLSFATPNVSLPVVLAADDDYGISRIELYRSLNDSRPLPVAVPIKMPPPTRWNATMLLPLSTYGLEAGDEIKLFARVEDNSPAGPKGAESPVAVVRLIAQSDFERLVRARQGADLLQSKYQEARRRLESLGEDADRLRKKSKNAKADDMKKLREELGQLARKMHAESQALNQSAAKHLGYDLDRQLSERLSEMARRLEEAAREAEKLAGEGGLSPQQLAEAMEKLRNRLQRERDQVQKEMIEPIEHLAQIMPLLEDASRFVILYQRQRALAERLKSLKGQDKNVDAKTKARMRELQAEQEEIRNALAKLLDDIEEHASKLPEDAELDELRKSAHEFVEQVRSCGAAEAMVEAEAGLAASSGTRGQTGAEKAADLLEKLIAKCSGQQGIADLAKRNLRFKPSLADCLGDTLDQLLRDAGLLPGAGEGANSGSSSQRSLLDNVGLYGQLPGMSDLPRQGRSPSGRAGGAVRPGDGDRGKPGGPDAGTPLSGASAADAAVPVLYRRRVAEYFQRIADETGK